MGLEEVWDELDGGSGAASQRVSGEMGLLVLHRPGELVCPWQELWWGGLAQALAQREGKGSVCQLG